MWTIYDEMIDGIPYDITVEEIACGISGTIVKAGQGCGFSISLEGDTRPYTGKKRRGMKLKELAAFIKSWNFIEASIGQAAINAYYNSAETVMINGIESANRKSAEGRLNDPFITYQNKIRGKDVAVIGHFPYIEQLFAPICNMSIIETDPLPGDFPDQAAEYILPQCEFAFITGKAIINKSLPRYLKLCENAGVIVVGASTPLAPCLFAHGIIDLSGIIIEDWGEAFDICCGGASPKIYRSGRKVSMKPALSNLY